MITIPLLICLIGLILYCITANFENLRNAWFADVGRLMFAFGLLAWLLLVGGRSLG